MYAAPGIMYAAPGIMYAAPGMTAIIYDVLLAPITLYLNQH